MAHIIVELTFDPPLTDEEHARLGTLLDRCLALREAQWQRSSLSADRQRMVCQFEAPDAQSVRDAYHSAGLRFDRIWAAEVYERK